MIWADLSLLLMCLSSLSSCSLMQYRTQATVSLRRSHIKLIFLAGLISLPDALQLKSLATTWPPSSPSCMISAHNTSLQVVGVRLVVESVNAVFDADPEGMGESPSYIDCFGSSLRCEGRGTMLVVLQWIVGSSTDFVSYI